MRPGANRSSSWVIAALLAFVGFAPAAPASAEMSPAMRLASLDGGDVASASTEPQGPQVVAQVNLSNQTMNVYLDEQLLYEFRISSGRKGYGTPPGKYRPQWLAAKWRSKKYNNAPMPWAVFFHGGYAIHGTTDIRHLGRIASHGCIRLHPDNAKLFFRLVQANGRDNTVITVVR